MRMVRTWQGCGVCRSRTSKPDLLLGVVVPFVEGIADKAHDSDDAAVVQRLNGCAAEQCVAGQSESCVCSPSSSQVHLTSFSSIMINSERTAVAVGHVISP